MQYILAGEIFQLQFAANEGTQRAAAANTPVQAAASRSPGRNRSPVLRIGRNEVIQTCDRNWRDVVAAAMSTARRRSRWRRWWWYSDSDVGEGDDYVGDEDFDVLVLNDADVEDGEHNGLDVFNVDDEELNVLNDDDDAVDGTMIFQWSVKVSSGPR